MSLSRPMLAGTVSVVLTTTLVLIAWLTGALATAATRAVAWTTVANQPYGTLEATGIELNDKLYSFGGYDTTRPEWTPTSKSYVYTPGTNTWNAIAPLPAFNSIGKPGVTHAGVATDGTSIYLAGGYSSNAAGDAQIFGARDVFRYNPTANTYTRLPDLPAERAAGGLAYVKGSLHFMGGVDRTRTTERPEHWSLSLSNLAAGWTLRAPLPTPRNHLTATALGGKIYVVGGQVGQNDQLATSGAVNAYDPTTGTWATLPPIPRPLSHGAATTYEGQLVIIGGESAHNKPISDVWAYDPALRTWNSLTSLPVSNYAGVAGTINGAIYLSGGSRRSITYKGYPEPIAGPTTPTPTSTPNASPAPTPGPATPAIRIDTGSSVPTVDQAGNIWQADTGLITPSTVAADGSTATAIAGTTDDLIYGTNRSNMGNTTPLANRFFDYNIPTSATTVNVRLLFSESWWTQTGKRRIDVYAETVKQISNLDLFAVAGKDTAVDRTINGVTVTGGVLNLRFQALADFPIISGIEVTCATGCGGPAPTPTPGATPTPTPGPTPAPGFSESVNFQPGGSAVPAGSTADAGLGFSATRGYGWVREDSLSSSPHVPLDLSANTRDRNAIADQRLDTFVHVQALASSTVAVKTRGAWELAVPDGSYRVTVAVGDPSYFDSRHTVRVEGQTAINQFVPTASVFSTAATVTVAVTDGRLTLDAIGGTNTKLSYVTVQAVF